MDRSAYPVNVVYKYNLRTFKDQWMEAYWWGEERLGPSSE